MEPTIFDFAATTSAPAPSAELNVATLPADTQLAPEPALPVACPVDQQNQTCAHTDIGLYAESITCSSNNDQGQAIFDIVLNVSWSSGEKYQSAKIVKSVAFDKQGILQQVLTGTPVTVVENKKSEAKKAEDSKKLRKTLQELAGIPGKGTFV